MRDFALALLLATAVVACGESGDSIADGGATADADTSACALEGSGTEELALAGACAASSRLGAMVLEVQPEYSFVDGRVANGVLPSGIRVEEMSMGGCRLMRKQVPFCDPICESDETCNLAGECIPYPVAQDIGDVCLAGLGESYVLTGAAPNYNYFNTQLAHPAFSGGERIELRSSGGVFAPVSLAGVGVAPIVATEERWSLAEGDDLEVGWETSESNAHASVYLTVNVDQHGSSPLLLECEVPDTGTATVPAALLDALLNSGISGFPVGKLVRRTVDSAEVSAGCMEFVVRSVLTVDVRVAGHTPCTGPGQCPSGQTCNVQLETCE